MAWVDLEGLGVGRGVGVGRASITDTSDIDDKIAQTRVPVLRSESLPLAAPSLGAGWWRPGHLPIARQRGLAKQAVATFSFHNGRQDPPWVREVHQVKKRPRCSVMKINEYSFTNTMRHYNTYPDLH